MDVQRLRWVIGESVQRHVPMTIDVGPGLSFTGEPMFIDFDVAYGHVLHMDGKSVPVKYVKRAYLAL